MASSINPTNSSRTSGCCPRRARPPENRTSSLDVRVSGSADRALPSRLSNEKPLLEGRVSLDGAGALLSPLVRVEIPGSGDSVRRRTFTSSSPDLPVAVGVPFTEEELGRTIRSTSVRTPDSSFLCPSPLLQFITAPASFERYTPPPKKQYDSHKYYNMLGARKDLEDCPLSRLKFHSFKAASSYLAGIMPTSGDFLVASYELVNSLLLGIKDPISRREKLESFCFVPKEYALVLYPCGTTKGVDTIFQEQGMGDANFYGEIRDTSGRVYFIYQMIHGSHHITGKLHDYVKNFNEGIEEAESRGCPDPVGAKLNEIILFFLRCEQLQPVKESRRTNLAVLNYLLAKYNFPCVLFTSEMEQIAGMNISTLDYLHFDHLRVQVIQGMQNWCKEVGIAYPF